MNNKNSGMKILIVSDAWHPQVNGVVRTLEATSRELEKDGHSVHIAGPDASLWNTVAAPSYPSIKLELFAHRRIKRLIDQFMPDFIHIATEGPLGWAARHVCLQQQRPFTTSYHTRFPEYLASRVPKLFARFTRFFSYAALRRFHAPSSAIMVSTPSIQKELSHRRFRRLVSWSRGVDTGIFQPYGKNLQSYADLPRPILLYVGRVAVEKNLRAFLDLQTTGSKIVIGDGPDLDILKQEYPTAHFLGSKQKEDLARHYAAADLFVFPSTTDTFGLVLLEACACGLRIASYPAPGPIDIFADKTTSTFAILDADLQRAVDRALNLSDAPTLPAQFAAGFSWAACTRQFFDYLQAPTPKAVRRILRLRQWLGRRWQHGLALPLK